MLENYKTCELVKELVKREGVKKITLNPYEILANTIEGPVIVLIIED